MGAGQVAEFSGDKKLAVETYSVMAKALSQSQDEKVRELVTLMEGVVRRLDLIGKEVKIEGKYLGGEPLEDFVTEEKIPWPILYTDEGQNPAIQYYGVFAIPTLILVGKDGKAVSTTVRGPELNKQLESLLGRVESPGAENAKSEKTKQP
jgi:hypothetical protein